MLRRIGCQFLPVALGCFAVSANAQTSLSQNSGINGSDTWVTMDLTIQAQNVTATLPASIYNPATNTSSTSMTIAPAGRTFHIEAGYDSSGGVVMNLYPTGTAPNPLTSSVSNIGFVRFSGGQIALFDINGNALPISMPNASIPSNWPLNLLGSNPGTSILSSVVVPNIQSHATVMHAALSQPTSSSAALTTSAPRGGTTTWTYVLSGSTWIAQQVTIPLAAAHLSGNRVIQFANVHWNDNTADDAARAASTITIAAPPPANTATPPSPPASPSDAAASGPPTISAANCSSTTGVYNLGGSQNVVLQHGIWSNGCAWTRMANWLNQDFLFGKEIVPTLSSNSSLASQGTSLINEINSQGGTGYILLGHSQGGLISRYAAQQMQTSSPLTARGVITVDTPHLGANLTYNTPLLASEILEYYGIEFYGSLGCYTPLDNFGCFAASLMFAAGAAILPTLQADVGSLSWEDLMPGSAFLTSLNGHSENFLQAGVVGLTPQRFAVTRTAVNFLSGFLGATCNPEDSCGERAIAAATDEFYDIVVVAFIFSEIEASYYCDATDNSDYCNFYLELEQYFATILTVMDTTDYVYNSVIDDPGDGSSDAIVQGPSQYYPYSTAHQYPISRADSHTGALRSSYVHTALDAALLQFGVPARSSCAISVPSSPISAASGGGTETVSVTTAAGCYWSAVSQAPWIGIASGVNGTASGTITLSVAANTSHFPRTGTVEVGTGNSSSLITIDQFAPCFYTLSEGPLVAVQPTAGSHTVSVTTQSNCAWTAVSNSTSWLTITSGASGTGSGTFTYTTTANSTTADRVASIQVMDQTITVVDGITVGTPSTATITLNGVMRQGYVNCHGPKSTCDHVYDTGSISITVSKDTFTYEYVATDTSTTVAAGLASAMNTSLSPVTASSSGTTLVLRSAINGTANNYPLSVSYLYDTTYFSSPSFGATLPSPAQLSGGTN